MAPGDRRRPQVLVRSRRGTTPRRCRACRAAPRRCRGSGRRVSFPARTALGEHRCTDAYRRSSPWRFPGVRRTAWRNLSGAAGIFPLGLGGQPVLPSRRKLAGCALRFRHPAAELLRVGVAHKVDRVVRSLSDMVTHRNVAHGTRLVWILGPLLPQVEPHDLPPLRLGQLELAHPEPATQNHPDRTLAFRSRRLTRCTAHPEGPGWAPAELHFQAIVASHLTGLPRTKLRRQRFRGLPDRQSPGTAGVAD